MSALLTRLVCIAGALLVSAAPAFAAADELHGLVLTVLTAKSEAIVRHDAFGGMPAMTMVFRVPQQSLGQLRAGDRITARVGSGDPEVLQQLQIVGRQSPPAERMLHQVTPLSIGDVMPDTQFFDQSGRGFTFNDFRGQTVVLAFVYTRCRDPRMCPLISSNFAVLQRQLLGLPFHLVEVTLDPAYDTPTVLARYGERFGANPSQWTFGTGPVDVVTDFAARFGIAVFADPAYGLIHSERTAIINRNGQITDFLDEAAWSTGDVAERVRELSAVPTNPIAYLDYELSKASAALCGNSLPGYSGLLDLFVVFAIFGSGSWILYRIGRKIFFELP